MTVSKESKKIMETVGALDAKNRANNNKVLISKFEKNMNAIAKLNKEIEREVGHQIEKRAELEANNATMRAAILQAMEDNDVDKFDGDLITITRVKATTRTTFDSKKFAEERPKTYAKYTKTSNVKASIRLKIKA